MLNMNGVITCIKFIIIIISIFDIIYNTTCNRYKEFGR